MPAGLTQKPLIPGELGRVYWTLTGGVGGKWWGRVPRALKSRGIQQPAEGVKGGGGLNFHPVGCRQPQMPGLLTEWEDRREVSWVQDPELRVGQRHGELGACVDIHRRALVGDLGRFQADTY